MNPFQNADAVTQVSSCGRLPGSGSQKSKATFGIEYILIWQNKEVWNYVHCSSHISIRPVKVLLLNECVTAA